MSHWRECLMREHFSCECGHDVIEFTYQVGPKTYMTERYHETEYGEYEQGLLHPPDRRAKPAPHRCEFWTQARYDFG